MCSFCSPHNTLYLELWCPTVAPSILVTSNKGRMVAEFEEVAIGESREAGSPAPRLGLL